LHGNGVPVEAVAKADTVLIWGDSQMEWKDLFPPETKPEIQDMAIFIGGEAGNLWCVLVDYMEQTYRAKPKITYSGCTGKPGWNVKFQKSGQSFGTFYPEKGSFSVLIVISYKLDSQMQAILPTLSPEIAETYRQAGDFMKNGKWIMFRIKDAADLEDYKRIAAVKMLR
jgi:hypothetical protein